MITKNGVVVTAEILAGVLDKECFLDGRGYWHLKDALPDVERVIAKLEAL